MNVYEQYNAVLSGCLLLRDLCPEEASACISAASPSVTVLKKGEQLVLPEKLRHIYFVLSGRLNVLHDSGMNASFVHNLIPGRCFGIAFCAAEIPCHNILQAAEKTELLRLSYEGLLAEAETRTRLLENLLAIASKHLLTLSEKIDHTQARSVRVKLSVFFRDQMQHKGTDHFRMEMSRKELADYLNVTYPAMLRELRQMQEEGILQIEGNRIAILDRELLVERGSEYNIL